MVTQVTDGVEKDIPKELESDVTASDTGFIRPGKLLGGFWGCSLVGQKLLYDLNRFLRFGPLPVDASSS